MKKRDRALFLGAIMLMSTVAFGFLSNNFIVPDDTTSTEPQLDYVGAWQGFAIYAQKTGINTSIYYLQLYPGYDLLLRADPRDAELVPSPASLDVYTKLYSSSRVYAVFDNEHSGNVSLAYAELARFLSGRPFEVVFGTTSPYEDDVNRTFPVKEPFNTTDGEAVIYLKLANETRIDMINNTIIVSGTDLWNVTTATAKLQLIMLRLI